MGHPIVHFTEATRDGAEIAMSPVLGSGRSRRFTRIPLLLTAACLLGCGSTVSGPTLVSGQQGDAGLVSPAGGGAGSTATTVPGSDGLGAPAVSGPVAGAAGTVQGARQTTTGTAPI